MPTLLIVWEPADTALGTDLVRHLRVAADKVGWQLASTADARPGDDLPRWYRARLQEAEAVVFVASVDLMDNRTDGSPLAQALELAEKRPDFRLMSVLARATEFWPELERYPIFPEKDRPVDPGQHRDRDLRLAVESVFDLLLGRKTAQPATDPADDFLIKNVLDAQKRLHDLLHKNLPSQAVALLKSVVRDADEREKIATFEAEWNEIHHEFNRANRSHFSEFEAQRKLLFGRLATFVDGLHDDQLVPGWRGIFGEQWLGFGSAKASGLPFFGLLATASEIKIPETSRPRSTRRVPGYTQHPDSHSATAVDEYYWPSGHKMDFRRGLRLAQDCLAVEDFDKALHHCEKVRHTLDPESAQLYEYLLITFVKKETPAKIVEQAIFGDGQSLRYVWLFAGRFMEYQQAGKCSSETGEWNVRAIAAELSTELGQIYARFEEDNVLDLGKKIPLDMVGGIANQPDSTQKKDYENRRALARKCVETALDLHRYFYHAPGFLDIAANELAGAGKFRWVDGVAVRDGNFHIFSSLGVDVETRIGEIKNLLADFDQPERDIRQADLLRENLLGGLRFKFQKLVRQMPDWRTRLRDPELRIREALVRLVNASILGYEMFNSEEFLALPKHILFEQKELDWFDFDENGQLIEHADCAKLKFPARDVLEKTLQILSKNDLLTTETGLERVRLATLAKYRTDTARLHENLETAVGGKGKELFELKNRRGLVECIRRWKILHKITGEMAFLDYAVRELAGAGLFQWLDFAPTQIAPVPAASDIGFDPLAALFELRQLPVSWSEAQIEAAIAGRIFQKVGEDFRQIPPGDAAQRAALRALLLKTLACQAMSPAPEYLAFLHDEIVGETKLAWLDISPESRWVTHPDAGFDALAVALQLPRLSTRYNLFETRKHLAINRYRDAEAAYFREVSEFPDENGLPERKAAIEFIRRSKVIYRFFPEQKFLEIPFAELRGHGRIRWRNPLLRWLNLRWIFPFDYHTDNMHFNFNYQWELREIQHLWDASFELMEAMMAGMRDEG
ncbi:MAG: hypothetical protein ACK4Q5_01365 [Saprospiraceae bacterium]